MAHTLPSVLVALVAVAGPVAPVRDAPQVAPPEPVVCADPAPVQSAPLLAPDLPAAAAAVPVTPGCEQPGVGGLLPARPAAPPVLPAAVCQVVPEFPAEWTGAGARGADEADADQPGTDQPGTDEPGADQPGTAAGEPGTGVLPPVGTAPAGDCDPGAERAQAALAALECTVQASRPEDAENAEPGDTVCFSGDMDGDTLAIERSGTADKPIVYAGDGDTVVGEIRIQADHVVVMGFHAERGRAPGIQIKGDHVVLQGNTVTSPQGHDYDGLRFFGDNLRILDNVIRDIENVGGAHADCMQTFQSDTPSSRYVIIDGNRCERVDNMCLMAEGPGDLGDGGSGQGVSSEWIFSNNYCDTYAGQALMIEAVQNVSVLNNVIEGEPAKAFAFDIGSTGAVVRDNQIGPGVGFVVGMDDSSRPGYEGPEPQGAP